MTKLRGRPQGPAMGDGLDEGSGIGHVAEYEIAAGRPEYKSSKWKKNVIILQR